MLTSTEKKKFLKLDKCRSDGDPYVTICNTATQLFNHSTEKVLANLCAGAGERTVGRARAGLRPDAPRRGGRGGADGGAGPSVNGFFLCAYILTASALLPSDEDSSESFIEDSADRGRACLHPRRRARHPRSQRAADVVT